MKVIYTRYGVKELPETPAEVEAYNEKMKGLYPGFVPLEMFKRKPCDCICHKSPPNTVFHFMPCC